MTTHLVQQMVAAGNRRSANGIALGSIAPISNGIATEAGAAAHWIFGADNPTHADRVAALQLRRNLFAAVTAGGAGYATAPDIAVSTGNATFACTISGGAVNGVFCTDPGTTVYAVAPTLIFSGGGGAGAEASVTLGNPPFVERNCLRINGADHITSNGRNGLLSRIADASPQSMWAVMRRQPRPITAAGVQGFGNVATGLTTGQNFLMTAANIYGHGGASTLTIIDEPDSGWSGQTIGYNWFFVCISTVAGVVVNGKKAYIGGIPAPFVQANSGKTISSPVRRIGIGNVYSATTGDESFEFAEFGIFNSAMADEPAMAALYARAKARMALRGIAVK